MMAQVAGLERLVTMSGPEDRLCVHCGHPFSTAESDADLRGPATEGDLLWHCPRCGQPHRGSEGLTSGRARAARQAVGLIP